MLIVSIGTEIEDGGGEAGYSVIHQFVYLIPQTGEQFFSVHHFSINIFLHRIRVRFSCKVLVQVSLSRDFWREFSLPGKTTCIPYGCHGGYIYY
jgi:hypothetical protein